MDSLQDIINAAAEDPNRHAIQQRYRMSVSKVTKDLRDLMLVAPTIDIFIVKGPTSEQVKDSRKALAHLNSNQVAAYLDVVTSLGGSTQEEVLAEIIAAQLTDQ